MIGLDKINCNDLILAINKEIDKALKPLLPHGVNYALVDFPNHSNAGDSAIWLGERAWLRKNKNSVVYICDIDTYSSERLAVQVGNGIILLHGGGNFGDLWTEHHQFRERVIQDFPKNKIIQLPQTIFFKDSANLERARQIFNKHSDLTFLCRDQQSLELSRKEFSALSILCPDMAFAIGSLKRPCDPQTEIVWLARTDKESLGKPEPITQVGIERTDWVEETPTKTKAESQYLTNQIKLNPDERQSIEENLYRTYDSLASERMLRGCQILSRGKIVVSNRLHAHILCLLMDIPHVLLDNNYGKVKNFSDAWTKDCEIIEWANSTEEVIQLLKGNSHFRMILNSKGITLQSVDNLITRLTETKTPTEEWTNSEAETLDLWVSQLKQIEQEIVTLIPEEHSFILVDDNQMKNELNIGNRIAISFLEKNGQYWGAPQDDETAIEEIERLRLTGAKFIVFTKPSFWWLIYYSQLHWHLRSTFTCLLENDRLVVFAL